MTTAYRLSTLCWNSYVRRSGSCRMTPKSTLPPPRSFQPSRRRLFRTNTYITSWSPSPSAVPVIIRGTRSHVATNSGIWTWRRGQTGGFRGQRWRHVRTEENPADLASKGVSPSDLIHSTLWWNGPPWLQQPPTEWHHFLVPPCRRRYPRLAKSFLLVPWSHPKLGLY